VPWTAAYVDARGDPTCDVRSNIAAESRVKIVYDRRINIADDPGIKEALGFLMTLEIAHRKSFEKALYSIEDAPRWTSFSYRSLGAPARLPARHRRSGGGDGRPLQRAQSSH